MENREIFSIIIAFVALSIIISFRQIVALHFAYLGTAFLFAFLILASNIISKKLAARSLDADVEHDLWYASRFGLKPGWKLASPVPLGLILSLIITAFSLGAIKCMLLLSYETKALKRRAARRFGHYSFTEMTDWHNALVGAAGVVGVIMLAIISYFIPFLEGLPSLAVYYVLWSMIPWSKLDGAQILVGSRVLYIALALVALVLAVATFVIK